MTRRSDAVEFEEWMEYVWSDVIETLPEGIVLYASPDYDDWHNAIKSAEKKFNARFVESVTIDDESWLVYSFSDNSRVAIKFDGSGVTQV